MTIPDSVTTIGDNAFYNCTKLTSVTIPDSVTTIGASAFNKCTSLTSVTIPDSVTTIGAHAFNFCTALTSVTIPDSVTTIGNSAFYNCESLTSVTIPDSVTTIGDRAFYSCESLTSVTIPDSVTTIGNSAFAFCFSLTSVTIPDSVTTIGDRAFSYCEALTSVTIPDSVTSIGAYAFFVCYNLTSVTIPDSVTTIGGYAFYECISLTSVYYTGTQEQWDAIQIGSYNTMLTNATRHYIDACATYGHTEEVIPGKAASTCYETGLTQGMKCTVCGEDLIAQEIIPAQHLAIVIIPGYPATCTQNGWTDGKGCDACGELVQDQEYIPAGHTEVTLPDTVATCTQVGLSGGTKCSACGKILVPPIETPALGHTEEIIPGYPATCTETGLTEGKKCTVCNEILVAQEVIPATGHWENIIPGYPATCTESGLTDGKTCSVCGEVLAVQETISALGHSYDDYYDADCNACGDIREVGTFKFENYRVIFSDNDESRKNWRVEVYKLGDQTVADPTDENALKAIDPDAQTIWGITRINNILITDAGNYVLLLKYNVGTAVVKVPMVLSVSADPKLIIDKNNKITAIDENTDNINHRIVVYYLGENTVEDIYDEATLKAIDAEPETHWQMTRINRLALTKGGNYVLHLCYNKAGSNKITVAQQFTVFSIPSVSVNINNMLVAIEENFENRNHRATVFFLGENTVEDPFDESEVKAAAISSKTYWGLPAINKAEILKGGNYVIHLYYNVGTSEKRTLALDMYINERPALEVEENGKISVSYTDPEITNPRVYIYNVGDKEISDIYDETALKAVATPNQVWGLSSINKKQLTPGTYVVHLYYSIGTSAKKTVALKVTI